LLTYEFAEPARTQFGVGSSGLPVRFEFEFYTFWHITSRFGSVRFFSKCGFWFGSIPISTYEDYRLILTRLALLPVPRKTFSFGSYAFYVSLPRIFNSIQLS